MYFCNKETRYHCNIHIPHVPSLCTHTKCLLEFCRCIANAQNTHACHCVSMCVCVCLQGTYKETSGSEKCMLCPVNTYNTLDASSEAAACLLCPSDSNSPSGTTTLENCLCNVGYTGPNGGNCSACGAGM
jgi:hypothetical protein